jgi:hypothetical protein
MIDVLNTLVEMVIGGASVAVAAYLIFNGVRGRIE